ncbi:hypothetical protein HN51_065411 [Arachis hypogaea]
MCAYKALSLDAREDMMIREVPRFGKEAATKAIKEWGQPMSKITHLIFCTTSGVALPGVDYELIVLLGLDPSVKRYMMYHQGCFAGGTVLRLAKDLAENNKDARVLIVCSENTAVTFRGPSERDMDSFVGQALFADGAAAIIIGSDPIPEVENPIFEIVSTDQQLRRYRNGGKGSSGSGSSVAGGGSLPFPTRLFSFCTSLSWKASIDGDDAGGPKQRRRDYEIDGDT